jgi:hypothetical protein
VGRGVRDKLRRRSRNDGSLRNGEENKWLFTELSSAPHCPSICQGKKSIPLVLLRVKSGIQPVPKVVGVKRLFDLALTGVYGWLLGQVSLQFFVCLTYSKVHTFLSRRDVVLGFLFYAILHPLDGRSSRFPIGDIIKTELLQPALPPRPQWSRCTPSSNHFRSPPIIPFSGVFRLCLRQSVRIS